MPTYNFLIWYWFKINIPTFTFSEQQNNDITPIKNNVLPTLFCFNMQIRVNIVGFFINKIFNLLFIDYHDEQFKFMRKLGFSHCYLYKNDKIQLNLSSNPNYRNHLMHSLIQICVKLISNILNLSSKYCLKPY